MVQSHIQLKKQGSKNNSGGGGWRKGGGEVGQNLEKRRSNIGEFFKK